jgi:hypothetical protein
MNWEIVEVVGVLSCVGLLFWIGLVLERIASLLRDRAH